MPEDPRAARLSIALTLSHLPLFVKLSLFFALLFLMSAPAADAQVPPPCPTSSSTISFTFTPTAVGDSHTETINLAPCETVEVHESHNMQGDGNRGTNLALTYSNSDGQLLFGQTLWGFYTATDNRFPNWTPEPFPWVGVRAPQLLPVTFKVESEVLVGYGYPPTGPPTYNFTIVKTPRPGYNVGGYDYATAPLVPSLPATYKGSLRDGWTATPLDPGQYFKVRLGGKQAIYAYGSATAHDYYGANFVVDIYDSSGQPLTSGWVFTSTYGTGEFTSGGAFVNPDCETRDFYIRAWSRNYPVYDFTLTIDTSSTASPPNPVAPDATGSGAAVNSEEYKLPATIDPDVLQGRATELWAKLYWPANLSGGPYPLAVFLHGNHGTCGQVGTSPRNDNLHDKRDYCYENCLIEAVTHAASGSASTVTFKPIASSFLTNRCCCVC